MAEAIVKALETAVIKGSGVGEPKGVTIHTVEIPAAQQITVVAADMPRWDKWKKNVFAQIPLAYEGNGIFLMTKPTFETYIEGMVDAVGQPIARTNYGITGSPIRRFGGYEVLCIEAGDLPNYETAAVTDIFAVFVDLSEYILNSNLQMTSKRYFDEVTDEWINKMTLIADGKLRDPNGVLLIKKGA
jgi:HK97 family phage major capsid protein